MKTSFTYLFSQRKFIMFFSLCLLLSFTAIAQCTTGVLLDNWSTTTTSFNIVAGNTSASTTTAGAGIIGGERDIAFTLTAPATTSSNVVNVVSGNYDASISAASTVSNMVLTYDGSDGIATGVNTAPGLGDINMNGAGSFKTTLALDGLGAGKSATVTIRVYSDATHWSDASITYTGTVSNPTFNISIPHSSFVQGAGAAGVADFISVNAVQLSFTSDQNGLDITFLGGLTVPCAVNNISTISQVSCNNNGTVSNGADDFISFLLTPAAPIEFYVAPYTYTVTAIQNGNPVTVLKSDGTAATAVPYGYASPFKLGNGTPGAGNVIVTVTPNWGSYASSVITLTDPGSCVVACSPGTKTATYTYLSPVNNTDAYDWQAYLPKFDVSGGKTLTQVKLTYGGTVILSRLIENRGTARNFTLNANVDITFNLNSTSIATSAVPIQTGVVIPMPAGILVPAQGNWMGDGGLSAESTIGGMSTPPNTWLAQALNAGLNPTLDPRWVTNATGNATHDDDIILAPLFDTSTYNNISTYTAAADLSNFTGTGNIPLTYSTFIQTGLISGGNQTELQVGNTYFTATVEYTYTETCPAPPTVSNVSCENNGTYANAADDFMIFQLDPAITSNYSVTASFAGSPVPILLMNNNAATNVMGGVLTYFKIPNGSLGSGNFTLTITPTLGTPTTVTVANIGTCSVACITASTGNVVTHRFYSPYLSTDINTSALIPKFDAGTNRILTNVSINYGITYLGKADVINANATNTNARFRQTSDAVFNTVGTIVNQTVTAVQNPLYPALNSYPTGTTTTVNNNPAIPNTLSYSLPGDLSSFIGTGNISNNVSTITSFTGSAVGGITFTSETYASFYYEVVYTYDCITQIPLPVTIVNFTTAKKDTKVELNWKTATEINSAYFEVQHSNNATTWTSIGTVNAAGNSSIINNYSFTHNNPLSKVNYYRLKMIDTDGKFKYSDVRVVNFEKSVTVSLFPNPVTETLYVTGSTTTLNNVAVLAMDGRLLKEYKMISPGAGIDMKNYQAGIYIIKVTDVNGKVTTEKVIKK